MLEGMQPFSLSADSSPDYTLSIDEIPVYNNVTSLMIMKGYTIRGVYVSYCTLQPDTPSMPLVATNHKNKTVPADIEL